MRISDKHTIHQIIRYGAAIAVVSSALWYRSSQGYEPFITGIGGLITFLSTFLIHPQQEYFAFPPISQPKRNDSCSGMSDALEFFSARFASAFPGARGVQWFSDPQDCINRISVILADPLEFDRYAPIWWWRGYSNFNITRFRHIGGRKILMNHQELVIDKIAAIHLQHPSRMFVYVQTKADKASGVYPGITKNLKQKCRDRGYVYEELGLHIDQYFSREEYDDGVARIKGVTVNLDDNSELRARFLSPYNFVIAPQSSVINQNSFDPDFQKIMNAILQSEATVEELATKLRELPPRRSRVGS